MAISEPDVKRLWGKAAGRCSYPTCGMDCLPFLDETAPTIVGEMAHVIASSAAGPRGRPTGGDDQYSNLILLCPTHHTLVDRAPTGKFTAEAMLEWRANHERRIEESLAAPLFPERSQLDEYIGKKLIENQICWSTYGPESDAARSNSNSTAGVFWAFRKLAVIVPNNRQIISAIRSNSTILDADQYYVACQFVEHAEGFERNCTILTENVPRFPAAFGKMFNGK